MESCEKLSALLDAFIDGELPQAQADRVRRHLTECEDCRAYVEDAFALRNVFEDLADVQVPETFAQGVMEAVRNAPPQARTKRRPLRPMRILAPLAACLAIAAVVQLGPLSSRMTEDAAQVVTQETSQAADPAQTQESDASSGTQDKIVSEDTITEDPAHAFTASAAPKEVEQAQVQADSGSDSQAPTAGAQTPFVAPESSGLQAEEPVSSDEVPAQDDPRNNVSITTARVEDGDPSDTQEDAPACFTQLTLTAHQADALPEGLDAADVICDPDTGAELQRIYYLDRTQFEALTKQLEDVSWEDSGSGEWAKIIVNLA